MKAHNKITAKTKNLIFIISIVLIINHLKNSIRFYPSLWRKLQNSPVVFPVDVAIKIFFIFHILLLINVAKIRFFSIYKNDQTFAMFLFAADRQKW